MVGAKPTGRSLFFKNWYAPEALPIVVIVGIVLAGGTWFTFRQALGPTIVWTKANPQPWNSVQPRENTKLRDGSKTDFERKWTRDRL